MRSSPRAVRSFICGSKSRYERVQPTSEIHTLGGGLSVKIPLTSMEQLLPFPTAAELVAKKHEPLVSVVVAAYGRPTILPFALRSAVAQTLEDIEIIVVGDAAGAETRGTVRRTPRADARAGTLDDSRSANGSRVPQRRHVPHSTWTGKLQLGQ
jgi:hypothetical protein